MKLVEFDGVWFAPDAVAAVLRNDQGATGEAMSVKLLLTGVDGLYAPRVVVADEAQFADLLRLIDPERGLCG